jgi:hypothetical protein
MKIDTLKKKLEEEFNFSEFHEQLEQDHFSPGTILLMPYYREYQRPWMTKAYNEWLNGDRTIVLVAPFKPSCMYFKRYVTDVAEIRHIKTLNCNNHKIMIPMVIAIYKKRVFGEPNFCVSFD